MWPNPQQTADLVTFTEELLDRKLYFLCSLLGLLADVFPKINDNMYLFSKLAYSI